MKAWPTFSGFPLLYFLLEQFHFWSPAASGNSDLILRALLAGLTAVALARLSSPKIIRMLRGRKITEPSKGFTGLNPPSKQGTPILGGLIILLASTLATLLWCDLANPYLHVVLGWGLAYAFLGFLDDWSKLRPDRRGLGLTQLQKYGIQILLASLLAALFLSEAYLPVKRFVAGTLSLPFSADWRWDLSWGYAAVIILFLVYSPNAVNITDGMDGLATFPVMLLSISLAILACLEGHPAGAALFRLEYLPQCAELAIYLAALLGACGTFLWYNAHPASIFMGDTGSMALGGILGVIAVLLKQEVFFLLAGGLFVLETASSFLQNYIGVGLFGRRLFFRAPLHDHWLYQGMSESKITIRLWLVALLFTLAGLATLPFRL